MAYAENSISVNVYLDKSTSGWASKKFDYAVVAEMPDCKIQWNAVEQDNGQRFLTVRKQCPLDFTAQQPLHSAILKEIDTRWGLNTFKLIDWGVLCDSSNWPWCGAIAQESLKSKAFKDYVLHYPKSKLTNLNGLFVELANQTEACQPLAQLFAPFKLGLRLKAVEKVFTAKPSESHFPKALTGIIPAKQGNARVMYNVGMAYFEIVK